MPFSHTTYLPIKRFLLCWLTIGGQCSKKESILEYTKHTIRKNVCSTWSDAKWSEKACVCVRSKYVSYVEMFLLFMVQGK